MSRVYVWEFPVRVTHWLLVLSIVTLSITGFYIGAPFLYGDSDNLIMAYMRFAHFVAAFLFTVCVVVRMYWWFAGNKYAKLNQFIPATGERIKNTIDTGLFYAFLKKDLPHAPGHTGLAGLSYTFLFCMYLVLIITGSAMLKVAHGGGAVWTLMGGWSLSIMNVAYLRLIHHLSMWIVWLFVMAHVYIGWHNDLIEKNGLISSIFTGYKNMEDGH
ncbi:MAG TPA: Ni/Fe-hydrogenase, b-type cytochrome subunit [Dissulfurispiraceae bacterium]|nr:Ni/Fe-hydrogenase, b-type cytochrome subunit [Dissulfurispiraceae bacterium]